MNPFLTQAPGVMSSVRPEIIVQHEQEQQAPEKDDAKRLGVRDGRKSGEILAKLFQIPRMAAAQSNNTTPKNEITSRRIRTRSVRPRVLVTRMSDSVNDGIPASARADEASQSSITRSKPRMCIENQFRVMRLRSRSNCGSENGLPMTDRNAYRSSLLRFNP